MALPASEYPTKEEVAAGKVGLQEPDTDQQQTVVPDPGLEKYTGTVDWLSPWNNFWRNVQQQGAKLDQAVVGVLGSSYDHMTGTGARFSDRTPEQLQASIQEAQYKLSDLHSQYDTLDQEGARYGGQQLQLQIANLNADIAGMEHQIALKTGVVKPDIRDQLGGAVKWMDQHIADRLDEANGLKAPTPDTSPLKAFTQGIGQIPIIGPMLSEAPPPNAAEREDTITRYAGMFGQAIGGLPAYGNLGVSLLSSSLQRYQSARDEAKAAGLDEVGQEKAGTVGFIAGAAEAPLYHYVMGRFVGEERPYNVGELTQKLVKNMAAGAGIGAEQTAASNIIAVTTGIDPNRRLTDGLWENIIQQAGIMGAVGAAVDTPSFLLARMNRSLDPYLKSGQGTTDQKPAAAERPGALPTEPATTTPATPVTAEQLAQQLARTGPPTADEISARAHQIFQQRQAEGREGDATSDWTQAEQELVAERQKAATTTEAPIAKRVEPEAPVTPGTRAIPDRNGIMQFLAGLRERLGPRFQFRVMTPDQLPNRAKLELEKRGVPYDQYSAYYDKAFDTFVINPNGFDSFEQLHDALINKYLVNTLADRANIHPVTSYSQVNDSPAIAEELAKNPAMDRNTPGLYDRTSGNVYLNTLWHLGQGDPTGEALATLVHEIAGHQGIRTFFKGDSAAYDAFLDRVYRGMRDSGAGDRIAARFGMDMDGLADHYKFDLNNAADRRELAEELLARYSERFDPAELERAPSVISNALDLIQRGMMDKQGLRFSEGDALNFLKSAWRHTDPQLAVQLAAAGAGTAQKRINEYGAVTEDPGAAADNWQDTEAAIGRSSRGNRRNEQARGAPSRDDALLAIGSKLLRSEAGGPDWLDQQVFDDAKDRQIGRDATVEHNVWTAKSDTGRPEHVLKETKSGGANGPYGVYPALPGRSDINRQTHWYNDPNGVYASTAASPAQYLASIQIRNDLFPGYQIHFEGFTAHPGDEAARIVTSAPYLDLNRDFRDSAEPERNGLMRGIGFEPIDNTTYYNRDKGIIAMDLHDGNLQVSQTDPRVFHVIDGTFAKAEGQLLNHFDELVDRNVYQDFVDMRNQRKAAEQAQFMGGARGLTGSDYDAAIEQQLRGEMSAESAQEHRLRDQAAADEMEDVLKQQTNVRQPAAPATPEEEDLQRVFNLTGRGGERGLALRREEGEGLPPEVREQLLKTLAQQTPSQGLRFSAIKGILKPDDPIAVRAERAAPDQLLYERLAMPSLQTKVNEIYSRHLGNLDGIIGDFLNGNIAGSYGQEVAARAYSNISRDLLELRAQAAGDSVRQQQLDQVLTKVNKVFDERGTQWAHEGNARNDAWYGAEGVLAKYHGALAQLQEGYIRRNSDFKAAVKAVRDLLKGTNDDVSERLKNLFQVADRFVQDNSWKPLPIQYGEWVANNITEQARRAGLPPSEVGPLQELFTRFQQTITQLAKENGIEMNRPARERMSATDRIKEGLDNWGWMQRTLQMTVDQAQKTFADEEGDDQATLDYKQRMRDNFLAFGEQAKLPFTESQLERFLPERQVRIGDLVTQHRSRIASTIDSLSDYLVRNSNLNPEQAKLIENAVASHVMSAIDVRRQAEFERIIRDSAGKRWNPQGGTVSMQRFINLINMGAFEDADVADALAPSFGYTSYDPKFAAELRSLGDDLERLKADARQGIQGEAIRMKMMDKLNEWRTQNYGFWNRFGGTTRSIFLGNILTGLPTHVVAATNDFLEGMGTLSAGINRLPTMEAKIAAIPRVMRTLWDGLAGAGGGFDRFAHIFTTGVDPNRPLTMADIIKNAGEPGYVSRSTDVPLTGWLAPYNYIFRTVSALHALMRNPIEDSIEWLYAYDQLARQPGRSLENALDRADEAIYGNAALRQNAEQTARGENLTGRDYRLRVQEIIDQNRPPMVREVGKVFGTRTVFTQAPDGFLGAAAKAMQQMTREVPAMRYIVPFTNIVSNVVNATINWSPVGFLRSLPETGGPFSAERYFADTLKKAPTPEIREEELNLLRQDMLTKATMGTVGLASLWAMTKVPMPGTNQPLITVTGHGPPDSKKRYQLMDAGWMPNAIAFNIPGLAKPYYLPYEATPIAAGLSFIGNVEDSLRYDTKDAMSKAMYIATNTLSSVFFDRTFLRGIKDAMDAFGGEEDARKGSQSLMRLVQSWTSSSVPYAGSAMVSQLYRQFIDPKLYASGTGVPIAADLLRDLPFANWLDGSKPMLNILGEPINTYPYRRMAGQLASQDPIWRFLDEHQIFLSDPNAPKILGQTMTPEQRYSFTKYRGEHLKTLLSDNLNALSSPGLDPDVRQKMIDRFSEFATKAAKADVISGRSD